MLRPRVLLALLIALALVVIALVAERLYALAYSLPLSPALLSATLSALAHDRPLHMLLNDRPRSHAARLVAARDGADDTLDEVLADLRVEAGARFALIRTLATLASTLGLLTGIAALVGGFSPDGAGLDALEAGRPQRIAIGLALQGMAVGVATSALCFFALGRLRPLALALVAQDERLARRLSAPGES